MFKNFHWGHGITIFYLFFVAAIVTILIASFDVDRSLVADDYYAKDLAYQSQYEKTQNVLNGNEEDIAVNVLEEQEIIEILITSPHPINGTVQIYRPSDASQDFNVKILGNKTSISTKTMIKGKWRLKIEWTEASKAFYYEHEVYIN